jgi:hypothetical protein
VPPDQVSAPSKASAHELSDKVNGLKLLDTHAFVDACVLLHDSKGEPTPAGLDFVRTVRLINNRNADGQRFEPEISEGLFQFPSAYQVTRSEMLHTSFLAATLAELLPWIGELRARWLHQVPERSNGEVDICAYLEQRPNVWVPFCLLEFGLRCASRSKRVQTLAYSVNVSPQLPPGHLLLAAEVIVHPSDQPGALGWLRVSGVRPTEPHYLGAVLLWEGPLNALSASRLLAAADMVAQARYWPRDMSWRTCKNVAFGGGHVWKAYDYRERNVNSSERRSHELSLTYISGCEVVCQSTDLVVIRYPYLEGTHRPHSVGQWIALLCCVQRLHQGGIVHGDLRLSNAVFSSRSDVVTIIDYDFAGRAGEKRYPPQFNQDIDDGARARSASAGRCLLFEHDWFAIAAMMKKCHLEQAELRWRQAQELLEAPDHNVDRAIQLLQDCASLSITSLDDKATASLAVDGGPGTGSPGK